MECCICKKEIEVQVNGWAEGHNAEPVKTGRACGPCNSFVVIPTRLQQITE